MPIVASPEPLRFLILPGDGIGPEVVAQGVRVLRFMAQKHGLVIDLCYDLIGGQCWEQYGTFCRDQTVVAARQSHGVLVGAVGGPQWDGLNLTGTPAEKDGLMRLRQELDTYVGLRPGRAYQSLMHKTPFKPEAIQNADILVLREMCGGCFFRLPRGINKRDDGSRDGYDNYLYNSAEIERFARAGFELARRRRRRLASMDKSNVLEGGVLWRQCVRDLAAEYPDVELEHYYADNGFYQLLMQPGNFDVVLCDNLFGDLASDIVATLAGSLGMLPSACLSGITASSPAARPGIYEPVHGSAPDIAGQGIANPIGAILSVAMMLEYAAARADLRRELTAAVHTTLQEGFMTADLGGNHNTEAVTDKILAVLAS